jgi:hypothetical protein
MTAPVRLPAAADPTRTRPTQNPRLGAPRAAMPIGTARLQIGGSAHGYLAVGGASQQSGMAYWMVACSVYLYIAILGANVRICR